jgi:hypothetical protein
LSTASPDFTTTSQHIPSIQTCTNICNLNILQTSHRLRIVVSRITNTQLLASNILNFENEPQQRHRSTLMIWP